MKGIDFLRTMLTLGKPWVGWVMLLMMVNMVIPLFYLGTLEGKVVLGNFVFGALLQGGIFSAKGFVRLLGIGHIVWVHTRPNPPPHRAQEHHPGAGPSSVLS